MNCCWDVIDVFYLKLREHALVCRGFTLPILLNVCPLGQLSLGNISPLFTIYHVIRRGSCPVLQVNCSEAKNNHYYIPELALILIGYLQWAKTLFFFSPCCVKKALAELATSKVER